MPFATWWRGDPLPNLSPLPMFSARLSSDMQLITQLTHLSQQEVETRVHSGNQFYVAFMNSTPATYGWTATRKGAISELHFSFSILPRNCYLWDFLTLPQWRGRGIYPHLLQAIIQQEQHIDRFWIGYVPGNEASAHGIMKAGFHPTSDLVISEGHVSGLALFNSSEYAQESANFFHLPIISNL